MSKRRRYVVAYDVPDDRRRYRVARTLEGHGQRVQYSVFECQLSAKQFAELWEELEELIEGAEDSLRAYRLCPECAARIETLGLAEPVAEVPEVYVV
jgi:CRISPR-associated protein Cas2